MFCTNCGTPLLNGANFCTNCGYDLRNLTISSGDCHLVTQSSSGLEYHCIKVKIGDIIKFGKYPQNNGNIKMPIEWLVLNISHDSILLISRYGLDCKPYHNTWKDITWEKSDLRRWLNGYFYNTAFTKDEQKRICEAYLSTKNEKFQTNGGNNTTDKVFCLDISERSWNISDCHPTDWARRHGALIDSLGRCWWWLRSPGRLQHDAACENTVDLNFGLSVNLDVITVRPAIRLVCDHDSFYYSRTDATIYIPKQDILKIEKVKDSYIPVSSGFVERNVKQGDYIKFGSYYQNDNNLKTSIEWLVLENTGNELLLVSRFALICRSYHDHHNPVIWKNCTLRKWLNGIFYNTAFSKEEQKLIKISQIDNLIPNEISNDKIFCLKDRHLEEFSLKNWSDKEKNALMLSTPLSKPEINTRGYSSLFCYRVSPQNKYLYFRNGFLVRPALRIICKNGKFLEPLSIRNEPVKIHKGDFVEFGNYQIEVKDSKTPIKWLVLDDSNNELLLISHFALSCKQYHNEMKSVTWESSTLRKWLNTEFINDAFSKQEQDKIIISELSNDSNKQYSTTGGNNTRDRVFCLSANEYLKYFNDRSEEKRCHLSPLLRSKYSIYNFCDFCNWWLRTPGYDQIDALITIFNSPGFINYKGVHVVDNYYVRPALRIKCNNGVLYELPSSSNTASNYDTKVSSVKVSSVKIKNSNVSKFNIGDCIKFGMYEDTKIDWLVLDKRKESVLLLSRQGLAYQPFHNCNYDSVCTWKDSDLRKWLNDTFIKKMFSSIEQKKIKLSNVCTIAQYSDPIFTKDKVFCLGCKELERYKFTLAKKHCVICKPIKHLLSELDKSYNNSWRLRSPGRYFYDRHVDICWNTTACVYDDSADSVPVSFSESTLIRPALWLLV